MHELLQQTLGKRSCKSLHTYPAVTKHNRSLRDSLKAHFGAKKKNFPINLHNEIYKSRPAFPGRNVGAVYIYMKTPRFADVCTLVRFFFHKLRKISSHFRNNPSISRVSISPLVIHVLTTREGGRGVGREKKFPFTFFRTVNKVFQLSTGRGH